MIQTYERYKFSSKTIKKEDSECLKLGVAVNFGYFQTEVRRVSEAACLSDRYCKRLFYFTNTDSLLWQIRNKQQHCLQCIHESKRTVMFNLGHSAPTNALYTRQFFQITAQDENHLQLLSAKEVHVQLLCNRLKV